VGSLLYGFVLYSCHPWEILESYYVEQGWHRRPGQSLLSCTASHSTMKAGFHGAHAKLQPKLSQNGSCLFPAAQYHSFSSF